MVKIRLITILPIMIRSREDKDLFKPNNRYPNKIIIMLVIKLITDSLIFKYLLISKLMIVIPPEEKPSL